MKLSESYSVLAKHPEIVRLPKWALECKRLSDDEKAQAVRRARYQIASAYVTLYDTCDTCTPASQHCTYRIDPIESTAEIISALCEKYEIEFGYADSALIDTLRSVVIGNIVDKCATRIFLKDISTAEFEQLLIDNSSKMNRVSEIFDNEVLAYQIETL